MAKELRCPQCQAPVSVDVVKPIFTCEYCGAQSANTLFQPPRQVVRLPPAAPPAPAPKHHGCAWVVASVIVLMVLAGIFGSGKKRRVYPKRTPSTSTRPTPRTTPSRYISPYVKLNEPSAQAAEGTKLNAYMLCLVGNGSRSLMSRQRYRSWVDHKKGPTCNEAVKHSVLLLTNVASCRSGLQAAREAEPRMEPLEQAGDAYLAALTALDPLLSRVSRYFSQGDYLDDGCAQGRTLHVQLLAAFNQLLDADKKLRAALLPRWLSLYRRRADLAQKSLGTAVHYHLFQAVLASHKLLSLLASESRRGKDADLAGINAAVKELSDASWELSEQERAGKRGSGIYSSVFRLNAGSLIKAARELRLKLEQGRSFSENEKRMLAQGMGWMVHGSLTRALYYHERLLESVCRMRIL